MNIRLPARIGAFACLGVAIAMGLLALREEPEPPQRPVALSTDLPTDPLLATLRSCQLAGQAAGSDPGCLAAWAENRRRFLGQLPHPLTEPIPDEVPGKSSEPAIVANGATATFQQEQ